MLNRRDQYYVIDEAVQGLQLTASITNLPIRKLRFFREFFGYPNLLSIFKDNKRFGGHYDNSKGRLVGEADRWVEHILKADRDVFEQLLGSNHFYVYHSGDNLAMTEASDRIRRIYDYFNPLDWRSFEKEDLLKHKEFLFSMLFGLKSSSFLSISEFNVPSSIPGCNRFCGTESTISSYI